MLTGFLKKAINKAGYDIIKIGREKWPVDFEEQHKKIFTKVQPFTMTSRERVFGLIEAVKYISKHNIQGDVVECGVWKGGSMLAVAETLVSLNDAERHLYLYDTFEGMSEPSEKDISFDNQNAGQLLQQNKDKENHPVWAYSTLNTVKQTMALGSYNPQLIKYIQGKVEDTIPASIPDRIALLRLDTDWYESTKHELLHLFPRLVRGGVLIIDDYGFWQGARKAVDEYIEENKIQILLNRLDDTGRIAIKQ